MGRIFNISPQAFFQVNTLGAELLYKMVGDDAKIDEIFRKIVDNDLMANQGGGYC